MDWKIQRDPFYSELKDLGFDINEAGFFEDSSTEDVDISKSIRVLCTPLTFMLDRLNAAKNPCILLTTGSMCPPHQGHVDSMIKAKEHVESLGYDVVGGFISPGHDEYISGKNKDMAIPIHYRIRATVELIKDYDWLSVDPWEGLFCKVAVNFTDVYRRLEMYVKHHLEKDIPVFFVSGGDNSRFALTFAFKGNCIIVNRPGYEDRFEKYKGMLGYDIPNKNIHFIDGGNELSSTKLRVNKFTPDQQKKLNLRMDLIDDGRDANIHATYFNAALLKTLKDCFCKVDVQYLDLQKTDFKRLITKLDYPMDNVISMDSLIRANNNLEISRCYDLFGSNHLEYVERPGSLRFDEQLKNLSKDDVRYILFDDDVHTGNTMAYAQSLLDMYEVRIYRALSLTHTFVVDDTETLDCRDLLLNGDNNGLVVRLPDGQLVRAPYIYPYVCPFLRSSIGDPMVFSIKIWELNLNFHKRFNLKLSDYQHFQPLFIRAGFNPEDSMESICKWHLDLLRGLK